MADRCFTDAEVEKGARAIYEAIHPMGGWGSWLDGEDRDNPYLDYARAVLDASGAVPAEQHRAVVEERDQAIADWQSDAARVEALEARVRDLKWALAGAAIVQKSVAKQLRELVEVMQDDVDRNWLEGRMLTAADRLSPVREGAESNG